MRQKHLHFRILIFVTLFVIGTGAVAQPAATAFIQNPTKNIQHVWINGFYQGSVRPGETRYVVSDGFITNDSDRPQKDGSRSPTKESHGGWDSFKASSIIVITAQSINGRLSERTIPVVMAPNAKGEVRINWGSKPWNYDAEESAPPIIKGNQKNINLLQEAAALEQRIKQKQLANGERPANSADAPWLVGRWIFKQPSGDRGENTNTYQLTFQAGGNGTSQYSEWDYWGRWRNPPLPPRLTQGTSSFSWQVTEGRVKVQWQSGTRSTYTYTQGSLLLDQAPDEDKRAVRTKYEKAP